MKKTILLILIALGFLISCSTDIDFGSPPKDFEWNYGDLKSSSSQEEP